MLSGGLFFVEDLDGEEKASAEMVVDEIQKFVTGIRIQMENGQKEDATEEDKKEIGRLVHEFRKITHRSE